MLAATAFPLQRFFVFPVWRHHTIERPAGNPLVSQPRKIVIAVTTALVLARARWGRGVIRAPHAKRPAQARIPCSKKERVFAGEPRLDEMTGLSAKYWPPQAQS